MKLTSKTLLYYLLISMPLLLMAGVFSYYLIKTELRDSTDETIIRETINTKHLIKTVDKPEDLILDQTKLSSIQLTDRFKKGIAFSDTSVLDKIENEPINYRIGKTFFKSKGKKYLINIAKNTLEEEELMESLITVFGIIGFFLVILFVTVNIFISKTLWKPFYKTLNGLEDYDVKNHTEKHFQSVNTKEFDQLNTALNSMTLKIHTDFIQQKEFTENAAHEMQTPLAVINANLGLLMQSSNLKEEEMNHLQSIENTTKKLAKLNKALLLLSKIENNQFKGNESVYLSQVITKNSNHFLDRIEGKNIRLNFTKNDDLCIHMNPVLADILFTNLLQNAIRHNSKDGEINITIENKSIVIANSGNPLTIDPSDLFVRFKKNDASKESIGLGLSIVQSICNLYGFKIEYQYVNNLHQFSIHF